MIDRYTIDQIFNAANIVDVIGDYMQLKRAGVNYKGCCPFHDEKTPSFVVSPAKGLFKCFGCGKGGNVITFVMEHEHVSYPDALRIVAKKYGITVAEKEETPEEQAAKNTRESMFELNSWAQSFFTRNIWDNEEGMAIGLSYFRSTRGFTDETIRKFGLGYCPRLGDAMTKEALTSGYKEEYLLSTGLSCKSERDGRLFDRFHERVMFPIHTISGRVVGFGGRTLRTDKTVAKYQNSPESEIYSKRHEIYGLFFAKSAIVKLGYAIMVEGYTDVISMHQSGVENVVASSGTSLTEEQVRLLRRFTTNITVMYDGDAAGIKASLRGIDIILKEGLNVRIVLLPPEHDPDSFAQSHSSDEVHSFIRNNQEDFISFKAKLLLKDAQNDPIKRSEVIKDIANSIANIPDMITRAEYIRICKDILDVNEKTLYYEVERIRRSSKYTEEQKSVISSSAENLTPVAKAAATKSKGSLTAGSSLQSIEKEIIYYLLCHGDKFFTVKDGRNILKFNVAQEIVNSLDEDKLTLTDPVYKKIYEEFASFVRNEQIPDSRMFTCHEDATVSEVSANILLEDDKYPTSKMWEMKDVHISSEDEYLSDGVPKTLRIFKTKIVAKLIEEKNRVLLDPDSSEEVIIQTTQELTKLNKIKVDMSKRLKRNHI